MEDDSLDREASTIGTTRNLTQKKAKLEKLCDKYEWYIRHIAGFQETLSEIPREIDGLPVSF